MPFSQSNIQYGTLELSDELEEGVVVKMSKHDKNDRRWSVLEKLERRHYCRIRSCSDVVQSINTKCMLATVMLASFFLLIISFARALFFASDGTQGKFDFIIIGAGPAGSVVTRRLIDKGARVLLLEAGGVTQYDLGGHDYFAGPISRFDIPLLWASVSSYKDFHWQGYNLPGVLQAKGLGGCGIHNAMLYVRALSSDLAKWNLRGWSWEKILSLYKSLETYHLQDGELSTPDFHGTNGPITTTRPLYMDEVSSIFVSSAVQAGVKYTPDFNDPSGREGVGYYNFNIREGTRDSAAREFLAPILDSPKLTVELNAFVRRVIMEEVSDKESSDSKDSTGNNNANNKRYRAIGVEYEQDGVIHKAFLDRSLLSLNRQFVSARSVVVSGGALMSPKILMNSGIGPKEELKKVDTDVRVPNEWVGRNLQDHPAVGIMVRMSPSIAASFPSAYMLASHFNDYVSAVTRARRGEKVSNDEFGVMGSTGLSAGAFLVSPYSEDNIPDIQLTVFPTITEPTLIQREVSRIRATNKGRNDSSIGSVWSQINNLMLITVALLNPDARYELTLDPNDPINSPLKFGLGSRDRYLSDLDIKKLAWGVQKAQEIVTTAPLAQLTETVVSPSPEVRSELDYYDWVEKNAYPNSHWVGTARMGSSAQNSVIDEEMRVHGVDGLRVVDASVIPTIPNGNVHSTVLIVSSMGSEFITKGIADVPQSTGKPGQS